ncbi:MAG: YciI family protein [Leptolyngbyaceae bacterium]|nr:YciI family protein [Leptolyngbyaceae bacterium]
MPWFVKIETGIVEKAVFDQHVPAHTAFVQTLIEKGHEAKTGYWRERGGGMLLFKASDLAEAKSIVAEDPLVKAGCVTFELHEWVIVKE